MTFTTFLVKKWLILDANQLFVFAHTQIVAEHTAK